MCHIKKGNIAHEENKYCPAVVLGYFLAQY
jgi:hypothetical protein